MSAAKALNRAQLEAAIRDTEAKIPAAFRPPALSGWHGVTDLQKRLADAQAALTGPAAVIPQPPPLPGSKEALEARIAKLEKDLAAAKSAPTSAAAARIVETAARTTATALSAERRSPAPASKTPLIDQWMTLRGAERVAYSDKHRLAMEGERKAYNAQAVLSESGGASTTTKQGDDESTSRYHFGNHNAKQTTDDWMPWHAGEPGYPDGPTREELAAKYPHYVRLHSLPYSQRNAYYNEHVAVIQRESQGVNAELEKLPACPLVLEHHAMEPTDAAKFMQANSVEISRELHSFRGVLSRNNFKLERIYREEAAKEEQKKAREEQAKQTSRR